jgi:hypothetical protein
MWALHLEQRARLLWYSPHHLRNRQAAKVLLQAFWGASRPLTGWHYYECG